MIRLIKLCGFSVLTIQSCDPGGQAHPNSTTLKTDILSFSVIHDDYCKSQNKPNKKEPLTITIWNWPTWFSLMITLQHNRLYSMSVFLVIRHLHHNRVQKQVCSGTSGKSFDVRRKAKK